MVTITPERILQQSAEAGRSAEQVSQAAQTAGVELPENRQSSYQPVQTQTDTQNTWQQNTVNNQNNQEIAGSTAQQNAQTATTTQNGSNMQFGMENTQNFTQEDFDNRNQIIANQLESRLTDLSRNTRVNDRVRDEQLMEIVSWYGGNVDRNDPNWLRTIDNIYGRIGKWGDYYSQLSKNFIKTDYTVDQLIKTNPNQDTLNAIRETNPELYQSYLERKDQEWALDAINSILGDTEEETTDTIMPEDPLMAMSSVLWEVVQPNLVEVYNNIMNTPEIQNAQLDYNEKKSEVDRIKAQMNATLDDVRNELEWTGATEWYIRARAQKRIDELSKQYDDAAIEANLALTNLNTIQGNAKSLYDVTAQQYQIDRQAMMDKYTIMNDFYNRQDKYNYAKYQTDLQRDQYIKKQKYEEWDMQGTPAEQRKYISNQVDAILEEFAGIPIQRSREQIVNDIYTGLETWQYKSLWEALTKDLRDPIRWKKEYNAWAAGKMWVNLNQIVTIGDKDYIIDPYTQEVKPFIDQGNSKQIDPNTYEVIDLGNGSTVWVGETVTIWDNTYRIRQLWGSMTGWIDFAPETPWQKDPIEAFVGGEVVGFGTDKSTGNQFIEILWDNWYVYRYNHLDMIGMASWQIQKGKRVEAWEAIGIMGSTGKSTWVHLDLAVYPKDRATNKSVSPLNIVDQTRVLFGGNMPSWNVDTWWLSSAAQNLLSWFMKISDLPTSERSSVIEEARRFFENNKENYADDNEYKIRSSVLYNQTPVAAVSDKLTSISNVKFQLEMLDEALANADTWPLRELYEKSSDQRTNQDTKALRAQLEAILPDLARGIFGEKWVLTDTDIDRYRRTVPNLGNKQEVNQAISNNLKEILRNTFISTITEQAKAQRDVSWYADDYLFWIDYNRWWVSTNNEQQNQFTISDFFNQLSGSLVNYADTGIDMSDFPD